MGQQRVVDTYHLITHCKQVEKDPLSELVFSSTNKENGKQKSSAVVSKANVLDEMEWQWEAHKYVWQDNLPAKDVSFGQKFWFFGNSMKRIAQIWWLQIICCCLSKNKNKIKKLLLLI